MPSSVSVVIGFLILLILPFDYLLLHTNLDEFEQKHLADLIKNLVIIIYGYLLIRRFNYERLAGIADNRLNNTYLILFPTYFLLLGIIQYSIFDYDFRSVIGSDILILFFATLSVGFSEEIIFRGFVQSDLLMTYKGKPLLHIILLASFMFGGLHFLNLLNADSYAPAIVSQVFYATIFGCAFGVILLRTRRLWPLGMLHGIINFTFSLNDLPGAIEPSDIDKYRLHEAGFAMIVVLPLLFLALKEVQKVDMENL